MYRDVYRIETRDIGRVIRSGPAHQTKGKGGGSLDWDEVKRERERE